MSIDDASRGIGTGLGIAAMGVGLGIAFDAMRGINKKTRGSGHLVYKPRPLVMPRFEKVKPFKWKW